MTQRQECSSLEGRIFSMDVQDNGMNRLLSKIERATALCYMSWAQEMAYCIREITDFHRTQGWVKELHLGGS